MNNKNVLILLLIPAAIILMLLLFNNEAVDQQPVGDPEQVKREPIGLAGEDIQTKEDDLAKSPEEKEETMVKEAMDKGETMNQAETIVIMKTTMGDLKIKLNSDQTPKTVDNFVKLSKDGFYDNTIFHRVINGFMIQGGDPKGDGTGGPGYNLEDEEFEGEYVRGAIAMANKGVPNSAGSQFFIIHKDYNLPKSYVIFGQVVEGLELVDAIATAPVEQSAMGEMSKPLSPVSITGMEIVEN